MNTKIDPISSSLSSLVAVWNAGRKMGDDKLRRHAEIDIERNFRLRIVDLDESPARNGGDHDERS